MEILMYLCIAWMIETVVEWIKPQTKKLEEKVAGFELSKGQSALLGIACAGVFHLNMFSTLELHAVVATQLTGLVQGRGSNYIHNIVGDKKYDALDEIVRNEIVNDMLFGETEEEIEEETEEVKDE